ncbi:hypothetical protein POVWA2_040630 [Plasmodium ovale wallikeri]|uniref:Uncharacterized protein n=1 Tax=Plasmodium ovale wallikeri TaxID=864142 RepID=A0A1A8Z9D8_PLAOA|nr:hypothetical protein POVWA1_042120 [Plasmodium ovale wallikeri]SBT40874.1 hypothetical protein POVWA2_040630 [Plasmodium ovale wallikeri]
MYQPHLGNDLAKHLKIINSKELIGELKDKRKEERKERRRKPKSKKKCAKVKYTREHSFYDYNNFSNAYTPTCKSL